MGAVTVFAFNCSTFTVCVVVFFCTPTAVLLVVAALICVAVKFKAFEALLYFHLSLCVHICWGYEHHQSVYHLRLRSHLMRRKTIELKGHHTAPPKRSVPNSHWPIHRAR